MHYHRSRSIAVHAPTQTNWEYPLMHMPLPTTPVVHSTCSHRPRHYPDQRCHGPTMLIPQHLLPRLTPVAHQPLAPDILEETSPWESIYPLQAVETPAKEAPPPVPTMTGGLHQVCFASIRARSCSIPNFTVNVVRSLFPTKERKVSNVGGKLGQFGLNRILRISVARL